MLLWSQRDISFLVHVLQMVAYTYNTCAHCHTKKTGLAKRKMFPGLFFSTKRPTYLIYFYALIFSFPELRFFALSHL